MTRERAAGIRLNDAKYAIAQLEEGTGASSIVPSSQEHADADEEIIGYGEFRTMAIAAMAMASVATVRVDDSADAADAEAVFYSNVHVACTAPLLPLGVAAV